MSNVIYSGHSASSGALGGPSTGVSWGGATSPASNNNSSSGYGPGSSLGLNNPNGNVEVFERMPTNSAYSNFSNNNNVNSFTNFADVMSYIANVAGGFSNLQSSNNDLLAKTANDFNTNAINSANRANKFTEKMIDKQMAYQQYNADTSYQRAVKDLKAAGLNPILAAFNGGAYVPTGSSASGIAAQTREQGIDSGYGISALTQTMINSILPLSIASMINGSPNIKKAVNKTVGLVDKVVGNFVNDKPQSNGNYASLKNTYSKFRDLG